MGFDFRAAERRANQFGTGVVVDASVRLGFDNIVGDHCVLRGSIQLGDRNTFSTGVSLGSESRQRLRHDAVGALPSPNPQLLIGDDNFFEDFCSVHQPLWFVTKIASGVTLGSHSHIAHDVEVDDGVVTAAHCAVGGWVSLGERATLGVGVRVHPRVAIGAYAMLGAGAVVLRHVAPAATVVGVPARYLKVNRLGLSRAGLADTDIREFADVLDDGGDVRTLRSPAVSRAFHDFSVRARRWRRDGPTIPQCSGLLGGPR